MLVGHLAVGLVGKRFEPRLSLAMLLLAALLADFLWCSFMLAGLERIEVHPGRGAANYLTLTEIAMSHSLATNAAWGAALAAVYWMTRRSRRSAWMLFVAVVSHWVLDVVSHRPDMPLAPGLPMRFGLGLWTSVPATLIVEGGLWCFAVYLYSTATRARTRAGAYGFWGVAALLTLAWYNNVAGPPPADPGTLPISSFIFFALIVGWGYWMNVAREARPDSAATVPAG